MIPTISDHGRCGILNTHRPKDLQEKDWVKIKKAGERSPLANAGRPEDPVHRRDDETHSERKPG